MAFLALLGLLRALETSRPNWRPRVAWSVDCPPIRPMLSLTQEQTRAAVAAAVADGVDDLAKDHVFDGQADLNYPPALARELLERAASGSPRRADLWSALMSDAAAKDGKVDATPLCLLFGQGHQHFLDRLAVVPATASPPPRGRGKKAVTLTAAECLAEALFAAWQRPDEMFAFRWDPNEDVRFALLAQDPSKARTLTQHGNRGKTPGEHRTEAGQSGFDGQKMADFCGGRSAGGRMLHLLTRGFAPVTQHGANRLAAIGLPALTCVPTQRGGRIRLGVLGGTIEGGVFSIAWPIWREPAGLLAIKALLSHPGLRTPGGLAGLSVTEIRVAERITVGKFMNFGRARPLAHSLGGAASGAASERW